jgi:hypothetical protein
VNDSLNIENYRDLSNLEGIIFTFVTERGKQEMDYSSYLADEDLRQWINDPARYLLIVGRLIFSFKPKFIAQKPGIHSLIKQYEQAKKENPLRFFAPSGNQALEYLNDFDSSLCILTACNQFGKTQTTLIKKLINSIPCNPEWEIFTKYGVKYRPFVSPKSVGMATYDFSFHRDTTLPMMLDWIPKNELGVYARDYKGKGAKQVNLNTVPTLPLACGTKIHFAAMSQGQTPFEGNVKHDWCWDEQGSEAAFDGADERTRTILNGRHDFSLTPHVVAGRPDTGAGSWINKIFTGETTKGHSVKTYQGQVWDVPDWIYPEAQKVKAFKKWVLEPKEQQNQKAEREGQARFFGKWHESSGLVIDEWDSEKHIIEPFDIPKHWTWYRGVDHGTKHPAAALQCAVSPAGDLFIVKDWQKTGLVVSQIAKDIVEWSGNSLKKIGTYQNPKTNINYDKYQEVQSGRSFQWTVFDPRAWSAKQNESGLLLHKLYEIHGLKMKKGSGKSCDHYVPIMKEWFYIDPEKKHFVTGENGAPRIYVFSTCHNFIKTIKRWVWEARKTRSEDSHEKESPTKKDDDLMDVLKYILQANPIFRGNVRMGDREYYDGIDQWDDDNSRKKCFNPVNRMTGY